MKTYKHPAHRSKWFNRQKTPLLPAQIRYMERVAICLAVEILAGRPLQFSTEGNSFSPSQNPWSIAARNLGAIGSTRRELIEDLAAILRLHGVQPIPTIHRALAHVELAPAA